MNDQKQIFIDPSDAINQHLRTIIAQARRGDQSEQPSIYSIAFSSLLKACEIEGEELATRIKTYTQKTSSPELAPALAGNMLKTVTHFNMGQRSFKKLVAAVFPAE